MSQALLCGAIASMNLVRFYYGNEKADGGYRTVEPHTIGYNNSGHLILSAWFLYGESTSEEGAGWRGYLLEDMTNITVLPQNFATPRPDYKRGGGKKFQSVVCEL